MRLSCLYYRNFIFPVIAIPIIKIRWFYDCLVFYNGNSYTGKLYIYSKNAPWWSPWKSIHVVLYSFGVNVTVRGYGIKETYLNSWSHVSSRSIPRWSFGVLICVHFKYISRIACDSCFGLVLGCHISQSHLSSTLASCELHILHLQGCLTKTGAVWW